MPGLSIPASLLGFLSGLSGKVLSKKSHGRTGDPEFSGAPLPGLSFPASLLGFPSRGSPFRREARGRPARGEARERPARGPREAGSRGLGEACERVPQEPCERRPRSTWGGALGSLAQRYRVNTPGRTGVSRAPSRQRGLLSASFGGPQGALRLRLGGPPGASEGPPGGLRAAWPPGYRGLRGGLREA